MKACYSIIVILVLICFVSLAGFAQNPIPNPGMESWSNGNPVDWWTSNIPPTILPVTQSSDAHSGSSSARLEILNAGGFPYPAELFSGGNNEGFPCTQRHAYVTGYYKFAPQTGDELHIYSQLWQGNTIIGAASESLPAAANWTQFMAPIGYFAPGNPDTCRVDFILSGTASFGGVAYIDDLGFSGINDIRIVGHGQMPDQFELSQNYPNPFNPTTNIEFSIPQAAEVKLIVSNQLGQNVATLLNEPLSPGSYSVDWNAGDLPSGIYFYTLTAAGFSKTMKLMLMK